MITCHLLLVVLSGSGSATGDAPFDGNPRSSSAMRAANLFCNYKPWGGAWAFLLVWEVTSFQPLPLWEFPPSKLRGIGSSHLSTTVEGWGSWNCRVSEKSPLIAFSSFRILHSLLTSSHSSFTWRHSFPTTSQLLAGQKTKCSSPGHSMLPQTWEAASSSWSSVWVQESNSEGTVMPKLELGCRTGLDSLLLSFVLKMPDKETWEY